MSYRETFMNFGEGDEMTMLFTEAHFFITGVIE